MYLFFFHARRLITSASYFCFISFFFFFSLLYGNSISLISFAFLFYPRFHLCISSSLVPSYSTDTYIFVPVLRLYFSSLIKFLMAYSFLSLNHSLSFYLYICQPVSILYIFFQSFSMLPQVLVNKKKLIVLLYIFFFLATS